MKIIVKGTSYLRNLYDDFEILLDREQNLVFYDCEYRFLSESNGLMIILHVKDKKGDIKKLGIPTSDVLAILVIESKGARVIPLAI